MDRYRTLTFVNSVEEEVYLTNPSITRWFELRGRSGFTAPDVDIITQKYANGKVKVLKRQLKPRTVTVSMIVMGDSSAERDSVFFEMVDRLMDVSGGGMGKLIVRRSDGMEVYLNCVYSSGLSILEEYRRYHRFTLEFYAPDPYFYRDATDTVISVQSTAYLTLSDTHLFGTRKLGEFNSYGEGVIRNESEADLQPVIKLQRMVGSLVLTNEDSGQTITIAGLTLTDGQTLIIDTREDSKSIVIENSDGSRQQAGQYLDWGNSDYEFPLAPGDNHISYQGGVGSIIESVSFTAAERYLSA